MLLIDNYLSAKDAKDRLDVQHACLRSLRIPIVRLAGVLFYMVKATSDKRKDDGEGSVSEFIKEIDGRRLVLLDTTQRAPVIPTRSWDSYILEAFGEFTGSLEAFVEKYAVHFDSNTIDMCEKLVNHQLIFLMQNARVVANMNRESGHPEMAFPLLAIAATEVDGVSMLGDYLARLLELVDLVELASEKEALTHYQAWRDDVGPAVGSGIATEQNTTSSG